MTQPPAGFYSDPQDPSQERWWDGQQWAASVRPKSEGAGEPSADSTAGSEAPGAQQADEPESAGSSAPPPSPPAGGAEGRPAQPPAGEAAPTPPTTPSPSQTPQTPPVPPPPPPAYGQPMTYGQPGAAPGQPAPGQQVGNSGYYISAWITAFLCCAVIPIVLNIVDNNQRKTQGLPPRYGPIITAVIINVVGAIFYMIAAGASSGGGSS